MMPTDVTEDMAMHNGTDPADMTCQERMAEVSALLALAMMRLWLNRRSGEPGAASERGISRVFDRDSLGLGEQSLLPVAAGKP